MCENSELKLDNSSRDFLFYSHRITACFHKFPIQNSETFLSIRLFGRINVTSKTNFDTLLTYIVEENSDFCVRDWEFM